MLDETLARRIDNPPTEFRDDVGKKVIDVVKRLVEFNGLDQ